MYFCVNMDKQYHCFITFHIKPERIRHSEGLDSYIFLHFLHFYFYGLVLQTNLCPLIFLLYSSSCWFTHFRSASLASGSLFYFLNSPKLRRRRFVSAWLLNLKALQTFLSPNLHWIPVPSPLFLFLCQHKYITEAYCCHSPKCFF